MKYKAVIKKSGEWWIGWLIDLPGVNAQEKTKTELIKSLRVGAEDMLDTEVPLKKLQLPPIITHDKVFYNV